MNNGSLSHLPKNALQSVMQRHSTIAAQQTKFLAAMNKAPKVVPVWTNPNLTTTSTATNYVNITSSGTNTVAVSTTGTGTIFTNVGNTLYCVQDQDDYYNSPLVRDCLKLMGECSVEDGESARITLPDGSVIEIERDGSFKINDKDAKVIYRANRVRDFNPFINVSDRMEAFIKYCGVHGVRQGEMLELPIKLFIGWLVLQAAQHDNEPEPEIKLIPDLRRRAIPKCHGCGRFIRHELRAKRIEFCAPVCFDRYYTRAVSLVAA